MSPSAEQVADLVHANSLLWTENADLRHQLEWFRCQIFGKKSERRPLDPTNHQLSLMELPAAVDGAVAPGKSVAAHTRRAKAPAREGGDESNLFFDEKQVPVEVIAVPNHEIDGLGYVILKYVRPVIKRRDTAAISCPPAPQGVIEGSRADVSFVAGMLVDKFAYHQPLYRLHLRLTDRGITVSRGWLTQITHAAIDLLVPIHAAQLESIRQSRVKAMDETPIKAGRTGPGKLRSAYFWPLYGERDEVSFLYFPTRAARNVEDALGLSPPDKAVLLSDGYSAYGHYARKTGITHAQCWTHTRRLFFEAQKIELERAAHALDLIGKIYQVEAKIRELDLRGPVKRAYRIAHARPLVTQFFV